MDAEDKAQTLATWCEEPLKKTLMFGKEWSHREKGLPEDGMVK